MPLDAAFDPFAAAGFVPETAARSAAPAVSDPFAAAGFVPETKVVASPVAAPTATPVVATATPTAPADPLAWVPEGEASPIAHPAENAAVRIGAEAVRQGQAGFGDGPATILSPEAQEKLDAIQRQGGWKGTVAQLASTIGTDISTAGRALSALTRGAQGAIAQTGEEVGAPQLGRDIAGFPEAFPTGDFGGGSLPGGTGLARAAKADLAEQQALRARVHSATQPLPEPTAPTAPAAPTAAAPAAPAAEPVPAGWRPMVKGEPLAVGQEVATNPETGVQYVRDSSAGAQVTNPRNIPNVTPAQRTTAESKSVQQTHIDRAGPARVDPAVYIEGVQPTQGAIDPYGRTPDGSLNAVAEKALSATDPDFKERLDHQNAENNTKRKDAFMEHAQDQNAIQAQEETRQANFDQNQADMEAASTPADPAAVRAHVEDAIDRVLNGAAGQRSAVEAAFKDIRRKFFRAASDADPEGATEWDRVQTDPEMLIGARRNIADKLTRTGQQDSANRTARMELQNALRATDDFLETVAPGYRHVREQWAADSIPIDQMTELQKYLAGGGKITDAQGFLRHDAVQKMLEKIVADRKKPGFNNAKSLTDDQMDMLIRLRNDVARDNYRDYIARTKGSDTTQQLTTAQRLGQGAVKFGRTALEAGAQAVAGKVAPVVGNMAVRAGSEALKIRREAKAAAAAQAAKTALGRRLLSSHPSWEGPAY